MPKLSPEKLNPAHDAAVRRMLAAWAQRREPANGDRADKPADKPTKEEQAPLKGPSSESLARH